MSNWDERLRLAKAFVFDFYGTLIEDEMNIPEMWEYLNELGYNSGPELQAIFEPNGFDGCVTPTHESSPSHHDWNCANWQQFARLSGVPEDRLEDTVTRLLEIQARFSPKPVPGSNALIELLRSRHKKVGLCSNWETPIAPYLEQAGLLGFDAISISAEVGARKPHCAIFEDICRKLDVDPAEAVFVGDNWSSDIVGALRAGLRPVWIRRSRPSCGIPHLVAEFDSLESLKNYIQAITTSTGALPSLTR
jgi:HAD superfamily hydrolase (TIGR01549 family)